MVRHGQVCMFVPFCNSEYTNSWAEALTVEARGATKEMQLEAYYESKRRFYRKENVLGDVRNWWANGNIVCNEHARPGSLFSQWWGDQFTAALRDMLDTAAAERDLPDCEFFINKRDYPHLKCNVERGVPVEPCVFYCGSALAALAAAPADRSPPSFLPSSSPSGTASSTTATTPTRSRTWTSRRST